jgi:WD40 repeat protein
VLKKRNIIQYSLMKYSDGQYYAVILTTHSDLNLVRISKSSNDGGAKFEFSVLDILDFGNNLLECSSLIKFNCKVYTAVSGSDFKIHIYEIKLSEQSEANQNAPKVELVYLNALTGHEDKISALDFINLGDVEENGESFLASGSKDNYIKIWKLSSNIDDNVLLSAMKRNIFRLGDNFIFLESSLLGHTNSISSVQWTYKPEEDGSLVQCAKSLILISSSLDFSV